MILAVDTTHEYGSLALACGESIVEEVLLHAPDGFAHTIFPELAALLERNQHAPHEIACFAAASGPGSFTGVRVGLACVKGLAEAAAKPVTGVSNLEALATFGTAPVRAVLLDARRGEVYGAVYDSGGEHVSSEVVTKLSTWLESLPDIAEFISPDFTPFREAIVARFPSARLTTAPQALAGVIARIAHRRLLAGQAVDPAALDANYVRRSDAELFWKEP